MNETRATRYQRLKRRTGAAALVSAAAVVGAIALTSAGTGLAGMASQAASGLGDPMRSVVALAVFVTLVVVIWEGATLPATLYLARHVQARYAGATVSIDEVLGAHFRAAAVAVPAAFAAAAVVVASRLFFGRWWWLPAATGVAIGRAALVVGAPWLLSRLAAVRAIVRPGLADRLAALGEHARVSIQNILEWTVDEATAAALVSGAGRSRRVYISSTLIRDWSDDEIAVVVAHELAHHRFHDLRWTVALDAVVGLLALAVAAWVVPAYPAASPDARTAELAALPVIGLVAGLVWLAATPVRHALSRRQERRADVFALALTGETAAFGAAIRRLGERYLAEERPSLLVRWFYHRHPSVAERLALADAFERLK